MSTYFEERIEIDEDKHKTDYKYVYPKKAEFKPGSLTHDRLVAYLLSNAKNAADHIRPRHPKMRAIDKMLTTYIKLSDMERIAKSADPNEPVSIVVPEMHASLETQVAFTAGTILQRPYHKYEGSGNEDILGTIKLQKAIDIQSMKSNVAKSYIKFWRDTFAYGRGFAIPEWEVITGQKMRRKRVPRLIEIIGAAVPQLGIEQRYLNQKEKVDTIKFEGNSLIHVNPYCAYPDPSVAAGDIVEGSFFAHASRKPLTTLMEYENEDGNSWFNIRYLRDLKGNIVSSYFERDLDFSTDANKKAGTYGISNVDLLWCQAILSPDDFDIGDHKTPERWMFCIAGDQYLIHAEPLDEVHGRLKVVDAATEFDGRTTQPISKIETVYGMNVFLNFEMNQKIHNQRFSSFNGWLFDPAIINEDDLSSPRPGMKVRTTQSMWNHKVQDFLMPLTQPDNSVNNIPEMGIVAQMMRDYVGAQDMMRGIRRQGGERVTAEEIGQVAQGGMGRMAFMVMKIALCAHMDIADMFAQNCIQYMEEDVWVKTTGDDDRALAEEFGVSEQRVKVSPMDLLVNYDIVAGDSITIGPRNEGAFLKTLNILSRNDAFFQEFNIPKLLRGMARIFGFTNVDQYLKEAQTPLRPQVVDNEEVEQQVDAGNMVQTEQFFE